MRVFGIAALAVVCGLGRLAHAQAPAAAPVEEMPRIRISDPNRDLYRLALPVVSGDNALANEALEIERRALEVMGLFNILNPASFPPDLQREGLAFSSAAWAQVGAQGVVKMNVMRSGNGIVLEGRLFQVGRGDGAVLSRTWRGESLRPLVYAYINEVIAQLTGKRGIFGSRIAFVTTGNKSEVASVGADGA
jgi:TolB protein